MNTAIFFLLSTLVLFSTSCSRSAKFSPMLDGRFDPEAAFRQNGYTLKNTAHGESIMLPKTESAWKSWYGSITSTQKQTRCAAIAGIISDQYNKTMGNPFDQLCLGPSPRSKGQPLTGDLIYNLAGVHGEMHLWLIPDNTNAAISYVIFLREDRLK
jgi:hypothetical protein